METDGDSNGTGGVARQNNLETTVSIDHGNETPSIASSRDWPKWVTVAALMPLVAGTTGPLSLLVSVSGLADPFRQTVDDYGHTDYESKPAWVAAMSGTALALEIIGNIALFVNFYRGFISYQIAMFISLISFSLKVCILFSLIGAYRALYPDPGPIFYSQGYWLTIVSAVLTFFSVISLVLNFMGYRRHYYQGFTISIRQRLLVMQNMVFLIWVALGALVFAEIEDFAFVKALYFINVSLLTLGFGDVTLKTTLGRAILMPYTFIGIVLLGLVVAAIRSVVIEGARERLVKRHMENAKRRKAMRAQRRAKGGNHDPAASANPFSEAEQLMKFQAMRKQQKALNRTRSLVTALVTIGVFIVFWIGGSAIFSATEGWTFFEGFYFCFVSLITIGYGDYTIESDPGRALFILWSFSAVPLMTILVSNVGDACVLTLQTQTMQHTLEGLGSSEPSETEKNNISNHGVSRRTRELPDDEEELLNLVRNELPQELLKLSQKLLKYSHDAASPKTYKYSFEEYAVMIKETGIDFDFKGFVSVNEELEFLKNYHAAVKGVIKEFQESLMKLNENN